MSASLSRIHTRLNARRSITYVALLAGTTGAAHTATAQIQTTLRAEAPQHATLNLPDGPLFNPASSFRTSDSTLFTGTILHETSEFVVAKPITERPDSTFQSFKPIRRAHGAWRAANWLLQEALGDDGIRQIKQGCDMAKRFGLRTQQY